MLRTASSIQAFMRAGIGLDIGGGKILPRLADRHRIARTVRQETRHTGNDGGASQPRQPRQTGNGRRLHAEKGDEDRIPRPKSMSGR
jgi:hypothetical protein